MSSQIFISTPSCIRMLYYISSPMWRKNTLIGWTSFFGGWSICDPHGLSQSKKVGVGGRDSEALINIPQKVKNSPGVPNEFVPPANVLTNHRVVRV